jgi:NADH-quinone oxidoreductase subunit J
MAIDPYTTIFYIFAVITLVSAAVVVFSKNIVHAAFALLFAFFGVAGIYVFLLADFLAVTQLFIYVGGILVLIIFGVMLTSRQINVDSKIGTARILPAIVIAAAVAETLLTVFWSTDWKVSPKLLELDKTAPQIGELLLTKYLLPFEIASIVLLVALLGAAMIARRERKQ